MEEKKKITTLARQPSGSLTISDHTRELARVVVEVNKLVQFPISGQEIVDWACDIERLAPETDRAKLDFLMDCFKTGELEWDRTEGIQNIFRGLRRVKKTETGYELLKTGIF